MFSGILIDSNDDRINIVDEIRFFFASINEVSNSNNLKMKKSITTHAQFILINFATEALKM